MDGWWNDEQYPDGAQEQNNPFARVPAADHVPQPKAPTTQPVQPAGAMGGTQQPAQLFSQIKQGDPYGYAAPEAVPAPAFSGDMQNPFGSTIGAVPFGSDMPPSAGGSFSGFSGDFSTMPFPPMGDAGAFTPPSYTGFPPLTGNTAPMQPVDPAWQTGSTAPMQPVDPAWQAGNTAPMPTLRWDPAADPAQWQPAADPAALNAQTQRWQPDASQPWEAPLVNVHTEQTSFLDDPALSLPEYPEASPDWTPTGSDAPITPEFMKDWAEKETAPDPNDRLNIPVYLRKRPLPAKRPVPKRNPVQETAPEQEAVGAAGESGVEAAPAADEAVPAAATEPAAAVPAAEETLAAAEATLPVSAGCTEEASAVETAEEPADADLPPAAEEPAEAIVPQESTPAEDEPCPAEEPAAGIPAEEAATEPEAAGEDTSAPEGEQPEETNPNARFMRPAVYVPLSGETTEKPEAAPKRRSRMERHAALQPAALDTNALKPRRRSHHTETPTPPETPAAGTTTDEEGNNRPFVPAAVAEDSGAEALPARPQSEAVTPDAVDTPAAPAAEPTGSYGDWPSLTDPDFAADDSYRYRQLFGHQPLYGDLMNRPVVQPLPGPAADDPNVPWVEQEQPAPMPTDDAIHAAAMEDTAREAEAAQSAPNPYAAVFPAEVPPAADSPDSSDDFLMDELPVCEEPMLQPFLSGAAAPTPAQPADIGNPLPTPGEPSGGAAEPAPAAQTGSDAFVPDLQPVPKDDPMPGTDPAMASPMVFDTPADPVPDFPPLSAPWGSETGQEADSTPLFGLFPDPADGDALTESPLGCDTLTDAGSFGTSSYDAGDMPNPIRGHMPYEVVSAFDTDSRRRAALAAAQAAAQAAPQAQPVPQPPSQPEAAKPPKASKPQKPPIKPFRVALLLAAAAMVVYVISAGSRLITSYVQNTEEWSSFYNSFRADNGTDVNHAGETVTLRSDGSTFPPAAGSGLSAATPPPGAAGAQSTTQTEVSGRTRQTRYADNELRNIREDMAKIREEYPEVVGRLEIPGVLDEWVVQRNNTYYLNHNYRGTAEEGGAVFMDSACTLFTPPENLHLRGSDNAPGKTFHSLWQYKTGGAAFVTGAAQATVTTIYEKADYLLVAVFEASMDPSRPNYFNYTSYPTFASDAEMMDYIAKARQRSLYALPTDVLPGDRLLTLSTVSNAPSEDEKPVCLVLIFRHRPANSY